MAAIKSISSFLLCVLVVPLVAVAQLPQQARIGCLSGETSAALPTAFIQRLGQHGWVQGKNLHVEFRYAHGVHDELPRLAAELAAARVDLIVTLGDAPSALAAKRSTATIPIVFTTGADPVQSGIVPSVARPGGNVTGFGGGQTLVQKRLEVLHEITPEATRYTLLMNPSNPIHPALVRALEAAARHLKLGLVPVEVREPREFNDAFARIKRERTGGVLVIGDVLFTTHMKRLIALAAEGRIPMSVSSSPFVRNGALVSFAVDHFDLARRAAAVADRILRGALPAEIPVEEAHKFELVINMRTAKALGLTISPEMRLRATEIIE